MSLNVGQLYVNIGANVSGLNSGLRQASQNMQDFGRKITGIGTKLTASISLPLAMVGKSAISMAMDAVESEALFTTSMGKMADSARDWSEELKDSYGLNAIELRKNVGVMNTMFQSMRLGEDVAYSMSTSITQLSHDMASFYNISQGDALSKLMSGMTGQTQPLMKLGINVQEEVIEQTALRHGLIKTGEEMNSQQKSLARYITIIEATTTSQGNLARELENPASQLRILRERINELGVGFGKMFLPIMSKVIGFAQTLTEKWANLTDAKKQMIAQFGIMAVAIPPVITGIGLLALAVGAILNPIGLVSVALLGLTGTFIATETQNLTSTENIADAWEHAFIKMEGTFNWFKDLIKAGFQEIKSDLLIFPSLVEIGYNKISFWDKDKSWGMTDWYLETVKEQTNTVASLVENNDKINNPRKYAMYSEVAKAGTRYNTIPTKEERENGAISEEIISGNGGKLLQLERQKELAEKTKKEYEESMASIIDEFNKIGDGIGTGNGVDKEAQRVSTAIDSITSSIIGLQESMKSQIGIFERFKWKATSTWKLLRNAESRDKAYREREEMLSNLSDRGLSQDLMVQLQKTDINQLGDLKGLDRMNDEQLKKWAGYTTNADRTAERMANVTVQNVNISIDGKEKNAKELAKEFYRELKLMGVDM